MATIFNDVAAVERHLEVLEISNYDANRIYELLETNAENDDRVNVVVQLIQDRIFGVFPSEDYENYFSPEVIEVSNDDNETLSNDSRSPGEDVGRHIKVLELPPAHPQCYVNRVAVSATTGSIDENGAGALEKNLEAHKNNKDVKLKVVPLQVEPVETTCDNSRFPRPSRFFRPEPIGVYHNDCNNNDNDPNNNASPDLEIVEVDCQLSIYREALKIHDIMPQFELEEVEDCLMKHRLSRNRMQIVLHQLVNRTMEKWDSSLNSADDHSPAKKLKPSQATTRKLAESSNSNCSSDQHANDKTFRTFFGDDLIEYVPKNSAASCTIVRPEPEPEVDVNPTMDAPSTSALQPHEQGAPIANSMFFPPVLRQSENETASSNTVGSSNEPFPLTIHRDLHNVPAATSTFGVIPRLAVPKASSIAAVQPTAEVTGPKILLEPGSLSHLPAFQRSEKETAKTSGTTVSAPLVVPGITDTAAMQSYKPTVTLLSKATATVTALTAEPAQSSINVPPNQTMPVTITSGVWPAANRPEPDGIELNPAPKLKISSTSGISLEGNKKTKYTQAHANEIKTAEAPAPKAPPHKYLKQVRELFPYVEVAYLEQRCAQLRDTDSMEFLVSNLLDEPDLPIKIRVEINPEMTEVLPKNKHEEEAAFQAFIEILPDADPEFLKTTYESFENDPDKLKRFISNALENRGYPTLQDYKKRQAQFELEKQFKDNFDMVKFLELFPDPFKHFKDPQRAKNNTPYTARAGRSFLMARYRKTRCVDIDKVYKRSHYMLWLTCKELDKIPGNMRTGRANHEVAVHKSENNLDFLQEIAFIENEQQVKDYLQGIKDAKKKAIEDKKKAYADAKKNGELLTCGCCYDEELLNVDMVTCTDGHLFCKECVKQGAEVQIGQGKTNFPCLEDCGANISLVTLEMVLLPSVFARLVQRKQIEEVKAAGIEDLETCPFCDFGMVPLPDDRVFVCQNPECLKQSCRLCKELSHIPLRCNEVEKSEEVQARTYIENKMTEALVRTCWQCKKKFVKSDGCNKMTCSCGALMCYVCRKPVKDYSHFNGQGGDAFDKCPLYSNNNQLHVDAIAQVAKEAKEEMEAKNPKLALKHDPTLVLPEAQLVPVPTFMAVPRAGNVAMPDVHRMEMILHPQEHRVHHFGHHLVGHPALGRAEAFLGGRVGLDAQGRRVDGPLLGRVVPAQGRPVQGRAEVPARNIGRANLVFPGLYGMRQERRAVGMLVPAAVRQIPAPVDPGYAGFEAGRAGFEAGRAGFEAGRAGFEAGRAGFEAGRAGFEAMLVGLEAGRAGFEAGRVGFEAMRVDREAGGRVGREAGRGGFQAWRAGNEAEGHARGAGRPAREALAEGREAEGQARGAGLEGRVGRQAWREGREAEREGQEAERPA